MKKLDIIREIFPPGRRASDVGRRTASLKSQVPGPAGRQGPSRPMAATAAQGRRTAGVGRQTAGGRRQGGDQARTSVSLGKCASWPHYSIEKCDSTRQYSIGKCESPYLLAKPRSGPFLLKKIPLNAFFKE